MLAVSVPHEPPPPVRPSLLFWKRDIGLLINITTSKSWHRALFFFFVSAVSDCFFAVKMFVQGIRVRHAWAFCQVISLRVSCMQLSKNGQVHPRLFKAWSARFSSPSSMMVAGSRSFLDFSGWSYWIFVDLRPRCILQFFYEAKSVANDVFWNSRPTQDFLRTSGKTRVSESYGAIDQMILYMMVVESHAVSFPIGSKYCMPCVSSHPIGSEHASVPCAQSSSR